MRGFIRRSLMVAAMQARQLLRRRLALAILLALPAGLYVSSLTQDRESAISFGILGVGWSVASASLFAVLSARNADPRLVLTGYRPAELMLGRFLLLVVMGGVLSAIGGGVIAVVSSPVSGAALAAACVLAPIVAVSLGLAVAAIIPRDLEGTLVIIGLVGVQLALSQSAWVNVLFPMDGPIQLAYRAGGFPADPVVITALHALVSTALLLIIADIVWSRRMRMVRRPREAVTAPTVLSDRAEAPRTGS